MARTLANGISSINRRNAMPGSPRPNSPSGTPPWNAQPGPPASHALPHSAFRSTRNNRMRNTTQQSIQSLILRCNAYQIQTHNVAMPRCSSPCGLAGWGMGELGSIQHRPPVRPCLAPGGDVIKALVLYIERNVQNTSNENDEPQLPTNPSSTL